MCLAFALWSLTGLSLFPLSSSSAVPYDNYRKAAVFSPPHTTGLQIHDPSVIKVNGTYYAYGVGPHINISRATSLDGPWTHIGSLLGNKLSVIEKGDRFMPWAPDVIEFNGTFYCYYSVSTAGCRDSAIGVATSHSPEPGAWIDHGVIVQSGTGKGSDVRPFNSSNTIDASVILVGTSAYLTFGSFWTGIWQVRLNKDLISADWKDPASLDAVQLVYEPRPIDPGGTDPNPLFRDETGAHPVEGSFISYRRPWYYLWFSHGKCCEIDPNKLPDVGDEYSIRVGRSASPRGPFVDRNGIDLVNGGGTVVYGSNGQVYAPGGQGILQDGDVDILYYHYLNRSVGYAFNEARMGYNFLEYDADGWPRAV